jgi:hypothetical protein
MTRQNAPEACYNVLPVLRLLKHTPVVDNIVLKSCNHGEGCRILWNRKQKSNTLTVQEVIAYDPAQSLGTLGSIC